MTILKNISVDECHDLSESLKGSLTGPTKKGTDMNLLWETGQ